MPAIPAESARLRELEAALAAQAGESVVTLARDMGREVRDAGDVGGEAAAAVERIVRAIAANRTELLPYRNVVPELAAAVKDPWRIGPLVVDGPSLLAELPKSEKRSLRLHDELRVEVTTDGTLGRAKRDGDALVFSRSRQTTARVSGPAQHLALVEASVAGEIQLLEADLLGLLLPQDLGAFTSLVEERTAEVERLMLFGRLLVEAAERLVCPLYGIPPDLEDA